MTIRLATGVENRLADGLVRTKIIGIKTMVCAAGAPPEPPAPEAQPVEPPKKPLSPAEGAAVEEIFEATQHAARTTPVWRFNGKAEGVAGWHRAMQTAEPDPRRGLLMVAPLPRCGVR